MPGDTRRHARRTGGAAALLLTLACAACDTTFATTFLVDELEVLAVQLEPSEVVFDIDQLRASPLDEVTLPQTLEARALVANPDERGGQGAIDRFLWSIGDPPLKGTPTLVSSVPRVVLGGGAVVPALSGLELDGESFTPAHLADTLDDGPLQLPLVLTAFARDDDATAIKMLTIRGVSGEPMEINENPTGSTLRAECDAWEAMGWQHEWTDEILDIVPNPEVTTLPIPRGEEVRITIDPDDDGRDGDVMSTMFATAGSIHWSAETLRTWVLEAPGDDYPYGSFRVYVVLRDAAGGQSWITILFDLEGVAP